MANVRLRTGAAVLAALLSGTLAEGLAAQTRTIDLSRLEGAKQVVSDTGVREVPAAARNVAIRPDQYVVARWAGGDAPVTPIREGSSQAWTTGFGFISVTRDGVEKRFRPIIETTGGLLVAPDADNFRGQVFVGLMDLRNPAESYDLERPVSLLITGDADSVSPQQIAITHTNLPFTEVTVSARDPGDGLDLNLLASGTAERATVRLPVVRPRLELAAAGAAIQGFGMDSVRLEIRAVGLQRPEGRVVILSTSRGRLRPSRVTLDEQGTGTATLRSSSVGAAEITASSPPFTAATASVRFAWPFAVLAASLVGGVIGAAVRRMRAGRVRAIGAFGPALLAGLLTGLVVVILYAAAVNVLPGIPMAAAGEGLAFALAAVGGFFGSRTSAPTASPGPSTPVTGAGATGTGTKKVFLSYRRDDAADVTGRIFDHLAQRFGRERVFMDVDSIGFGADFRRQVADALEQTGVLLAIVGDEWHGPRLADPNDYVAAEIGGALTRGIPVIPVLVEGARMPSASELPAALADFAYRNAAEVRSGRDFPFHAARLADSVATLIDADQRSQADR